MSAVNWGDVPTWLAAGGTVAAVVAALWIAHSSAVQDRKDRAKDREDAESRLKDERAIAQQNLADERARDDQQRHADYMTRLLLEIYDMYGAYKPTQSQEALFMLQPRLAVLPPVLAVAVRIAIGDTLTEPARDKAAWLKHRLGRSEALEAGNIGWDVVRCEAEFDLWWVREEKQVALKLRPWNDFEQLRIATRRSG